MLQGPAAGETLTMPRAVELALTHNFAAREALADMDAARAGVGEAATGFIPNLSASVSASGFRSSLNPDFAAPIDPDLVDLTGESYSTSVNASYPLLNTSRRLSWLQSRAQASSAEYALDATKRRLVRDVANAYLDVVEADALARLAQEDLKRRENALIEAKEMVSAGRRANFELLRAEAEKAQADARLLEASNTRQLARAELSRVIGVKLEDAFAVEMPELPDAPEVDPDDTGALDKRPEVRAQAASTQAALYSQRAATRTYMPSVNLFANWSRDLAPTEADLTVEDFSYGASLSVAFGTQAATLWRTRAARARTRGAQTIEERLKYEIEIEAKRAALNLEHRRNEREARKQALEASRRAFENTAERYRLGVATQTERIVAEATLAQAESDDTRADVALAKAVWNLRYAVGEVMEVQP